MHRIRMHRIKNTEVPQAGLDAWEEPTREKGGRRPQDDVLYPKRGWVKLGKGNLYKFLHSVIEAFIIRALVPKRI